MYTVYILKSLKDQTKHYVGFTQDLKTRLNGHNKGDSHYTKKYLPWETETHIIFKNKNLAIAFEKYLKKGSGFAFLKKRLINKESSI